MGKVIWIVLTLVAGAFLPIQAGLNTRLGKAIASPVYASLISFFVGLVGLLIYILITRQTVSFSGIKDSPGYIWIGGLLGAFYITVIIFAFPVLGPGVTFGLIVAGQMVVSILLAHFNILVVHQSSISFLKIFGVLLIVAGVIIIRRY